jgi:cytochrome c-type biogenesis protein CcsB
MKRIITYSGWLLVGAMVLWALAGAFPRRGGAFDRQLLAEVPVQSGGRIKPLGTEALTLLRTLSGKSTVRLSKADGGGRMPAIDWYASLLFMPGHVEDLEVFRIDDPQVKDDLELTAESNRFSMAALRAHQDHVTMQAQRTAGRSAKELSRYERSVRQLSQKMQAYGNVERTLHGHADFGYRTCLESYDAMVPIVIAMPSDREAWTEAQQEAFEMLSRLYGILMQFANESRLRIVPPPATAEHGDIWFNAHDMLLHGVQVEANSVPPQARAILVMQEAWRSFIATDRSSETAETLNKSLQLWHDLPGVAEASGWRPSLEQWFNQFDPFYRCIVLYTLAFLLSCLGFVAAPRTFSRWSLTLVSAAFLVHTIGMVCRMSITGRPPVTNLYESTLFVGWVCVLLGIILEAMFRNGFASVSAAAIGLLTLLKGFQIAMDGQDTMAVLVAVLDSNFWLATHVICITIGYSSCFFAALLGHVYLFKGIFTKSLDRPAARQLDTMAYGIVCFGLLFSLVGTILGGIWADQSWGRFWGWDPKENGALLICLWLIIILHARKGGYIRHRGTMICTVIGSIITAISWFGVNLLGTGLHSYGFTERGMSSFLIFIGFELLVVAAGIFLPIRYWSSGAALAVPPAANDSNPPDATPAPA